MLAHGHVQALGTGQVALGEPGVGDVLCDRDPLEIAFQILFHLNFSALPLKIASRLSLLSLLGKFTERSNARRIKIKVSKKEKIGVVVVRVRRRKEEHKKEKKKKKKVEFLRVVAAVR